MQDTAKFTAISDSPRISVCIPSYNSERYIGETLRSVTEQTIPPFEVLVQDDHSTDGTWKLLQQAAAENPRLKIDRNPRNMGIGGNCHALVSRSDGDFVLLLSADDLLTPDFLARCLEAFQNRSVDVVTTNFFTLKQDGNITRRKMWVPKGTYRDFTRLILLLNPFNINFTLFRRPALDRLKKGEFYFSRLMAWDYDVWLRISLLGMTVHYLGEPLGIYRIHGANLSFNSMQFYRPTILTILRYRKALATRYRNVLRFTLLRFLTRMIGYTLFRGMTDRRTYRILLREIIR